MAKRRCLKRRGKRCIKWSKKKREKRKIYGVKILRAKTYSPAKKKFVFDSDATREFKGFWIDSHTGHPIGFTSKRLARKWAREAKEMGPMGIEYDTKAVKIKGKSTIRNRLDIV